MHYIKLLYLYILKIKTVFLLSIKKNNALDAEKYWEKNHVNISYEIINKNDSLNFFNWRNSQYPGYLDLMPVKNFDNQIILDYGCGPGHDVVGFIEYSKPEKVVAADISSKILTFAKSRVKLHENHNLVEFIQINHDKLSRYENDYFDFINCSGVLHHLTDINLTLDEFYRVLKPNGEIRVMVYNKDSIWYHLYAPYVLQIVTKEIPKKFDADEAFRVSTDGPNCPVSLAYTLDSFQEIAMKSNFSTELIGVCGSNHEEQILKKYLGTAIADDRLAEKHRSFLKNISLSLTSNNYRNSYPGINLILKIKKISKSNL